jgi:hypothetical protein
MNRKSGIFDKAHPLPGNLEVYVSTKLCLALGAVLLLGAVTLSAPSASPAATQFGNVPQGERSQTEREMMDRQRREANKKRQQDIRDDTEKLFQLATELKSAVDKSNENLLSLEVVRKAEEVEKLAHRVKEKMKESAGPPLSVEPVPPRPPR